MWEQLEGTAADCIPAAGSGLFHCDKVSFVEAKASRVKGPKDDCYTLNWMEMRFLTHIDTHSILPSRTRTNTLSAKRACTPVTNPAFIVAAKHWSTQTTTHINQQLVRMTIATQSHWVYLNVEKKRSSFEFRSLASCSANVLNSQFNV